MKEVATESESNRGQTGDGAEKLSKSKLILPSIAIAGFIALLVRVETVQQRNEAHFISLGNKLKELEVDKLSEGKAEADSADKNMTCFWIFKTFWRYLENLETF